MDLEGAVGVYSLYYHDMYLERMRKMKKKPQDRSKEELRKTANLLEQHKPNKSYSI
jgi:hypothetical protein